MTYKRLSVHGWTMAVRHASRMGGGDGVSLQISGWGVLRPRDSRRTRPLLLSQPPQILSIWFGHASVDLFIAVTAAAIMVLIASTSPRASAAQSASLMAAASVACVAWSANIVLTRRLRDRPLPGFARGLPECALSAVTRLSWLSAILTAILASAACLALPWGIGLPLHVLLGLVVMVLGSFARGLLVLVLEVRVLLGSERRGVSIACN